MDIAAVSEQKTGNHVIIFSMNMGLKLDPQWVKKENLTYSFSIN